MTIIKQILIYSLFPASGLFISCREQSKPENKNDSTAEQSIISIEDTTGNIFYANKATEIGKIINSIFQDRNNFYWFGTNGDGVYRFDSMRRILLRFTEKDGLRDGYAGAIQEDKSGNIWIRTAYGISRFDGSAFTTFTTEDSLPLSGSNEWKIEPDDLLFTAGGGVYRYDGSSFTYLPLPKSDIDSRYSQGPSNRLSAYGVYCILKDKEGNYWFGTQTMGVGRYGQGGFTWFTEKGLSGPAVRALFEDRKGNYWFGNNGNGLLRLAGASGLPADQAGLINFTEEKGLGNPEFLKSGKPGPGTLARVWTINEDNNGNLWIGTADAGVWRYDGHNLTNYTTLHGLTTNSINTIYKDKKGELWFGTDGGGVCRFNGTSFAKFEK